MKIKLEIIGISSSQVQVNSFALVLGEVGGNRRLPIIIGTSEAQAIAIEVEKIVPNRPMTHDLFKTFAHVFDFNVDEIIISDLQEGVFFSKIVCNKDSDPPKEIDARPSDAIAIGLRFDAPIYTYEKILDEAGIMLADEDAETSDKPSIEDKTKEDEKKELDKSNYKDFSSEKLKNLLHQALQHENYETAAQIRDELKRRN